MRLFTDALPAGGNLAQQMADLEIRDYVQKPIRLPDLLEAIHRYCGPGQPQSSPE